MQGITSLQQEECIADVYCTLWKVLVAALNQGFKTKTHWLQDCYITRRYSSSK
jgi:hypothetical protein